MKKMSITLLFSLLVLTACISSKEGIEELSVKTEDEVMVDTDTKATENAAKSTYTIDELTEAILVNDTEMVQRIIEENRLDISQADSEGHYPLEMVLVMDNCEMAETLFVAGADAHVLTADGSSVYELAMDSNSPYLKSIFEEYAKK